jgi:hypothetical protein
MRLDLKKVAGFLIFIFGLSCALWIGYKYYMGTFPYTKGKNLFQWLFSSAAFIIIGLKLISKNKV